MVGQGRAIPCDYQNAIFISSRQSPLSPIFQFSLLMTVLLMPHGRCHADRIGCILDCNRRTARIRNGYGQRHQAEDFGR